MTPASGCAWPGPPQCHGRSERARHRGSIPCHVRTAQPRWRSVGPSAPRRRRLGPSEAGLSYSPVQQSSSRVPDADIDDEVAALVDALSRAGEEGLDRRTLGDRVDCRWEFYSPNLAEGLSTNSSPSWMYPRMAWLVVQRPWRMIRCSATPARAAVVAKPERSEWPLNSSGAYTALQRRPPQPRLSHHRSAMVNPPGRTRARTRRPLSVDWLTSRARGVVGPHARDPVAREVQLF